ncbi:TPR repeat-containing protein [compost metagenome]
MHLSPFCFSMVGKLRFLMKVTCFTAGLICLLPIIAVGAPPENLPVPAVVDIRPADHQDRDDTARGAQIVTNEELKKNPPLAARFLNQAVDDERWDIVRGLIPVYEASPEHDPVLLAYAQGALARHDREYDRAIGLYRELLAAHPELTRIRLDLARMLFENRQYDAARVQFEKARSDGLPDAVLDNLKNYLDAMDRAVGWSGSIDLSYLADDNINNASRGKYIDIGGRMFARNADSYPQSGHGAYYSGSIQRDFPLADHHSLRFQEQVTGRSYWDNHKYDDVMLRSYLGYSYSDAGQRLSLLPFYEKRWYGTEPYSSGGGLRTEYSRLLSSNWQVGSAVEYQRMHYDSSRYSYLEGHDLLLSVSLGYAFSSRLAIYAGADLGQQDTRSDSDTNDMLGLRAGFEAELPYGFSASLMAGVSERKYAGRNDIFAVRRKDVEDNCLISLWHRGFYFWGILPKVNFAYRSMDSNINYYSFDQKRVYLSATRAF